MTDPLVRPRRPDDLPPLVALLERQQPRSRYPFRWPLPFPPEQFLARATEERAWVAEVAGAPAGHIAVTALAGDEFAAIWTAASGRGPAALACISAFFVDESLRGSGVGGLLLDTAVGWIREQGRQPVLDVVQRHSSALAIYLRRGWRPVGEVRPPWLPDDEPPVLAMVLDPPETVGVDAR